MMIDLHVHSTYSDGTLTPAELVALARERGLAAIALTDHDSVDGLPEALAAGRRLGVRVVPGVELNVEWRGISLDLLGYFLYGLPGPALDARLDELRRQRDERNRRMLERLDELGLPLSDEELEEAAGHGAAGRPHIGLAMMRRGYVSSVSEAFARFLRRDAAAWVDRERMPLADAIDLIRRNGGLPVLAHPGLIRTGRERFEQLVQGAVDEGLEGIECYHPAHDGGDVRSCRILATRHNLVATGGSDFHGAVKPDIELGRGPGGMSFSDEILHALEVRGIPPGV